MKMVPPMVDTSVPDAAAEVEAHVSRQTARQGVGGPPKY